MRGQLWIIAAPSGGGKTSLIRAVLETLPDVVESVSHTTRAPRAGELEGVDYFFINEEEFKRRLAAGEFLEWAEVYGRYYGTSALQVDRWLAAGQDVLLNIDWQGAEQVRRLRPDTRTVFLLPPSLAELERRLNLRGDDPQLIGSRMAEVREQISHYRDFEFLIVNEDLAQATAELEMILAGARLRRERREEDLAPLLKELGQQ